jgi:NADPH:quinone reductase-like Zn-dependent oxidoreductase
MGCRVVGTSRTQAKLDRALALGLDRAVLVRDRFEPEEALEGWADVICDLVGAPYLAGNLRAARSRARIIVIGLTGGRIGEIDLGAVLRKRLHMLGTVLRTRSVAEKAALVASFREAVWPAFVEGSLTPVLDRAFSARHAAEAHRYLEANRNFGSVVLVWD